VKIEKEKYRQHTISGALSESLAGKIKDPKIAEDVRQAVMTELNKHHMIAYSSPTELGLLNAIGRTLIAISENPNITQRVLAIYLGVSEGAVQKCIAQLVSAGVVAKTKVKGKNTLLINHEKLKLLPDITRFNELYKLLNGSPEKPHPLF